ncbi:hypothetical protein H6P81_003483 [Aristolochia fimbriata]|uniref:BZIP domain-containing protein n=1 Tax=Aristolochia fimbriata TaxID=158543 RepID=A0AAV7FCP5_ARIFI|nr:hypothetical protein H6P81_003483 [Aristolochia fimbriata]
MEVGASSAEEDGEAASGATRYADVENFPLYRQSSIYSLTLDEFQHAVCEPGKNFGSMNMDEFLNNIWTAEENQALTNIGAAAINNNAAHSHSSSSNHLDNHHHHLEINTRSNLSRQSSLHRQGSLSLTLPAPLCRKTVEQVWSEIQCRQDHTISKGSDPLDDDEEGNHLGSNKCGAATNNNVINIDNPPRQPTFGEMTLEDFLIKAGVVREGPGPPPQPYSSSSSSTTQISVMSHTSSGTNYGMAGYHISAADHIHLQPPAGSNTIGKRSSGSFGRGEVEYGNLGRIGSSTTTGIVGFAGSSPAPAMLPSMPPSPLDHSPVEKVVERRQRRMIKNRESAARSRARKQAYTVELEAELEQLRKENTRLKKEQEDAEQRRKRKILEAMNGRIVVAAKSKSNRLRRTLTGPW